MVSLSKSNQSDHQQKHDMLLFDSQSHAGEYDAFKLKIATITRQAGG